MNAEQIAKLKELAQVATKGPWMVWPSTACNGEYTGLDVLVHDGGALINEETHPSDDDARFIAAANPAAVLELIALAEKAAPPVSAPGGCNDCTVTHDVSDCPSAAAPAPAIQQESIDGPEFRRALNAYAWEWKGYEEDLTDFYQPILSIINAHTAAAVAKASKAGRAYQRKVDEKLIEHLRDRAERAEAALAQPVDLSKLERYKAYEVSSHSDVFIAADVEQLLAAAPAAPDGTLTNGVSGITCGIHDVES